MSRQSYRPDAATIAALKVARHVGNQCVTCGQPHPFRGVLCSCGVTGTDHKHWTWASPDDGHTYRPRGPTEWLDRLIEEAERA